MTINDDVDEWKWNNIEIETKRKNKVSKPEKNKKEKKARNSVMGPD